MSLGICAISYLEDFLLKIVTFSSFSFFYQERERERERGTSLCRWMITDEAILSQRFITRDEARNLYRCFFTANRFDTEAQFNLPTAEESPPRVTSCFIPNAFSFVFSFLARGKAHWRQQSDEANSAFTIRARSMCAVRVSSYLPSVIYNCTILYLWAEI